MKSGSLRETRRRHSGLGVGEVGAITVARFRHATLITNDMQARQTAEELELPVSGSIGVLECAVELAVISGQEAINLLQAMVREGAWISDELLELFRQKVLTQGDSWDRQDSLTSSCPRSLIEPAEPLSVADELSICSYGAFGTSKHGW